MAQRLTATAAAVAAIAIVALSVVALLAHQRIDDLETDIEILRADATPTPLTVEGEAWACAEAWAALSDSERARYYSIPPLRTKSSDVLVPGGILDLVDKYCFK